LAGAAAMEMRDRSRRQQYDWERETERNLFRDNGWTSSRSFGQERPEPSPNANSWAEHDSWRARGEGEGSSGSGLGSMRRATGFGGTNVR
jgi:hypothetical protein